MEAVEEMEEKCGSLKVRSRKSIIENLEANQGVVQVVQVVGKSENGRNPEANEGAPVVQAEVERLLRELESCVYLDREKGFELSCGFGHFGFPHPKDESQWYVETMITAKLQIQGLMLGTF